MNGLNKERLDKINQLSGEGKTLNEISELLNHSIYNVVRIFNVPSNKDHLKVFKQRLEFIKKNKKEFFNQVQKDYFDRFTKKDHEEISSDILKEAIELKNLGMGFMKIAKKLGVDRLTILRLTQNHSNYINKNSRKYKSKNKIYDDIPDYFV